MAQETQGSMRRNTPPFIPAVLLGCLTISQHGQGGGGARPRPARRCDCSGTTGLGRGRCPVDHCGRCFVSGGVILCPPRIDPFAGGDPHFGAGSDKIAKFGRLRVKILIIICWNPVTSRRRCPLGHQTRRFISHAPLFRSICGAYRPLRAGGQCFAVGAWV